MAENTLREVTGEADADKFLDTIQDDGNGYVTLNEWMAYMQSFKTMKGAAAMTRWIATTEEAAQSAVHGNFDEDADHHFAPDDADRPASHILAAEANKLTPEEQEKAVQLFQLIDKDGNRQVTRPEVSALLSAPASDASISEVQDVVTKAAAALEEAEHKLESEKNIGSAEEIAAAKKQCAEVKQLHEQSQQQLVVLKGGEAAVQETTQFIAMLEEDGDGFIGLLEWLRYIRTFKRQRGAKQTTLWIEMMSSKAEHMVVEKHAAWHLQGGEDASKIAVASHVLSEQEHSLVDAERKAAVVLFRRIDKDGNERLTMKEVAKIFEGEKNDAEEFISLFEENSDGYIALTEWLRGIRKMKNLQGKAALHAWLLDHESKLGPIDGLSLKHALDPSLPRPEQDKVAVLDAAPRVGYGEEVLSDRQRIAAELLFKAVDRNGDQRLVGYELTGLNTGPEAQAANALFGNTPEAQAQAEAQA